MRQRSHFQIVGNNELMMAGSGTQVLYLILCSLNSDIAILLLVA